MLVSAPLTGFFLDICLHTYCKQTPPTLTLSSPLLVGKLPPRSDREPGVPGGADDGPGRPGVSADPSSALAVGTLRVSAWRRAGGRGGPAVRSPRQQCGDLHVSRQLPGRLMPGEDSTWTQKWDKLRKILTGTCWAESTPINWSNI